MNAPTNTHTHTHTHAQYENEDLIRYGLPEDVWFHVDDLSSAHVYLRQHKGEKLDDISETTLNECAQLVKANSIEGSKRKSVDVIYTKWRNLHKTKAMEAGAVSFKDRSKGDIHSRMPITDCGAKAEGCSEVWSLMAVWMCGCVAVWMCGCV